MLKLRQLDPTLDYDIDGLVLKVNDLNLQKRLVIHPTLLDGRRHINFLQKKQLQKLKDIIIQVGRTGAITHQLLRLSQSQLEELLFQMQRYIMKMK